MYNGCAGEHFTYPQNFVLLLFILAQWWVGKKNCVFVRKLCIWREKFFWANLFRLNCSLYLHYYASPSSGEAYKDRRLTTNFEFWVEILFVPTCFHVRIPKPCLSICPYPEKRNHHSLVNISPTLVIDTSMERFSRVLHHGNPKIWFFFKVRNSNFDLWWWAEITLASSISVLQ